MKRGNKYPSVRATRHNLPPLSAVAAVLLSLISCVLQSCTESREREQEKRNEKGKREITVTFEPQKWIVEQIAGDDFSVNVLLPPGADPESYSPTVAQLRALYNSSIWLSLYTMGFEHSLLDNLNERENNIEVRNAAEGIIPLEHTHGGISTHHHDEHHSHADHTDPHLWNSVKNMRLIAHNTFLQLSLLNPLKEQEYSERFRQLDSTLNSIDRIIASSLQKSGTRVFAIRHPSLAYFARDYGLEQIAIEAEGKEPSALQMKERMDGIRSKGVSTIVAETGKGDSNAAEEIARRMNLRVLPLNTNSSEWYIEILKLGEL